jgi:hypothetical protein
MTLNAAVGLLRPHRIVVRDVVLLRAMDEDEQAGRDPAVPGIALHEELVHLAGVAVRIIEVVKVRAREHIPGCCRGRRYQGADLGAGVAAVEEPSSAAHTAVVGTDQEVREVLGHPVRLGGETTVDSCSALAPAMVA